MTAAAKVWTPGLAVPGGRITRFAPPRPGMSYTLGLDFALGIVGKDFDAGELLDGDGAEVASLDGHWGAGFYDVLQPLLDEYQPFVVGEWTAHGAACLRKLYDTGRWMYFDREAKKRGNSARDQLGHVPREWDITLKWLQADIAAGKGPLVRDAELHRQLCRFGFRPRSQAATVDPEALTDSGLTWGAPTGEHDDKVRALALAWAGRKWIPQFVEPPKPLPANSIGKKLGYDREDAPKPAESYF